MGGVLVIVHRSGCAGVARMGFGMRDSVDVFLLMGKGTNGAHSSTRVYWHVSSHRRGAHSSMLV